MAVGKVFLFFCLMYCTEAWFTGWLCRVANWSTTYYNDNTQTTNEVAIIDQEQKFIIMISDDSCMKSFQKTDGRVYHPSISGYSDSGMVIKIDDVCYFMKSEHCKNNNCFEDAEGKNSNIQRSKKADTVDGNSKKVGCFKAGRSMRTRSKNSIICNTAPFALTKVNDGTNCDSSVKWANTLIGQIGIQTKSGRSSN